MLFKTCPVKFVQNNSALGQPRSEKKEIMHTGASFKQRIADLKSAFSAFFARIIQAAAEEEMAIRRAELNRQLLKAGPQVREPKHIHT
jgi:hypothetical protein